MPAAAFWMKTIQQSKSTNEPEVVLETAFRVAQILTVKRTEKAVELNR